MYSITNAHHNVIKTNYKLIFFEKNNEKSKICNNLLNIEWYYIS